MDLIVEDYIDSVMEIIDAAKGELTYTDFEDFIMGLNMRLEDEQLL